MANIAGATKLRATVTQTVTTGAAYASGNVVGGKLSFLNMVHTDGCGGTIFSAIFKDKSAQAGAYDLFLFDADPTNTTITDKSAIALNTADLPKCIGLITFAAGAIKLAAASTMGVNIAAGGLWLGYRLASGTTIFGILVTRGTPTYTGANDVSVDLITEPD